MTKRIAFDHNQIEVVPALGFTDAEDITASTEDETNPDHLKLRLAAALLNSDAALVIGIWAHLLTGQELTATTTKNLETLFQHYDDNMLQKLDEHIALYSRNKTVLTEEDLEAVAIVDEALGKLDA